MDTMRARGKILGKDRRKCEMWIEKNIQDRQIRRLAESYWQNPIVLYTGSGVSTGPAKTIKRKRYGLPTWLPLLRRVSGRPKSERWSDDPWEAADQAVRYCGGRDEFKRRLRRLISTPHFYTKTYGQLSSTFLKNAPTLRAVAAFCGQLTGRIINPQQENPQRVYYRTSVNPRIRAVLTANYDCFLESAASTLYRKSPLKPVTALGSLAGSMSRIPVFHIHGFVPHPFYHSERREQTIDELIITREDYDKYWNRRDVFGTTMGPQIHYLRYFTVLFVGFSFDDQYVRKLLCRVYDDYLSHAGWTHFALLERCLVEKKGKSFFTEMGIEPIEYEEHEEIPSKLGQVYGVGLATDRIIADEKSMSHVTLPELLVKEHTVGQRQYHYSHDAIWEIMQACRNEGVGASIVRNFETVEE